MVSTVDFVVIYLFLHILGNSSVAGVVTVTTSAVAGIPNQQAMTLRCRYITDEVITGYRWSRKTGSTYTQILSGSMSPQIAIFQDTWQNKGVFRGDFTSTLDIELPANHVTSSYAGTYRCQVNGISSTGMGDVTASVLFAPSISGIPSPYPVTESSGLQIDCSRYTTVTNPSTTSYTWTYKESTISSGAVLDISSISRSQAGQYTCTAINTQGSDSAPVSVDVQYGPGSSVTVSPQGSLERVEGSGPFTATCTAVCNPSCSISWMKGSTSILPGKLSISNISRTDQGDYTCQAQNGIGGPGQKTFTLSVYYAPVITSVPNNKDIKENTSPNIDCSSNITQGNPSSTSYRWTGPGGYSKTGAVLDRNVTRTQGGQYTCNATNTAGLKDTAQVNIDVHTTPPTGGPTAPSSGFVERNDLDCSAGLMHIHLPLSLFPTHKVTMRDPSCKVPSNGTHLVIDISLNQCGTTVTFTNDSVIFKNDLVATVVGTGATAASIIDYGLNKDDQRVPVSCEFPRQSRVDFGYMPLQRKAHFYEKQYGHLDFEVKHYQTAQFSTLIPHNGMPVGVALNTEVFIDIAVDHKSNKGVGIFVDSCIATPTTSPADPLWYPLIKDGCPMQADVRTFTAPDISDFRFSFLAFKFTHAPLHNLNPSMPASPMVYLHCQVSACPSGNCTTSCHSPTRTRRSADQQNSHLISTGPFYLKADDHDSTGYSGGVVAGTMSVAVVATLVAMIAMVAWRRSANKLSKYQASSMDATS